MSLRKPLVIVSGQIQQLQSGDTLSGPFADTEQVSLTNGDSGSHAIGTVVYISAADTAKKAQANAAGTAIPCGIATGTITAGSSGSYQTGGVLGGLSGLTAGSIYYLDPTTAGGYTLTAPSSAGQYVVELGVAISTTELLIRIRVSIAL